MLQIRAQDFKRMALDLRDAGEKDLRKQLFRGLQGATKPARQDVLDAIPEYMPGGYAAVLRKDLKLSASSKGGKDPQVKIKAKGKRKDRFVGPLDRGRLRHPLFGNRGYWFEQSIEAGFWTDTLTARQDEVRAELERRMAEVVRQLAEGE